MEMHQVLPPPVKNRIRDAALNQQLKTRRERLQKAIAGTRQTAELQGLLDDVDAALERMEAGTFGLCETCHDPIENDRLLTNPLCRYCLDHLSREEQQALERDLDLAYQIQHGLLPKPGATTPGWTLAYHYEPAGPVSGDYCDLIPMEDGSGLFLLGDVSGKGISASMLMTQLHAIFRSLNATTKHINELVAKANRVFCEGTVGNYFATLACGKLGRNGEVETCNAGHCYPLHVQNNRVFSLTNSGFPLGLFSDGQYSSQTVKLSSGDSLVVYSDGLSEAFNGDKQQYGVDRLTRLLAENSAAKPDAMLAAILGDLQRFRAGGPKTDDLTIMVMRRE